MITHQKCQKCLLENAADNPLDDSGKHPQDVSGSTIDK